MTTPAPINQSIDIPCRWFARLLLEGSIAAAITSHDLLSAPLVKELRQTFSKANLKEGSAAMVTQMKPIAMVSDAQSGCAFNSFFPSFTAATTTTATTTAIL